jgi:hypothetical protein
VILGPVLFIGLFLVVGIGSLVISIMTAVDASKYPDWAFQQTGSSKFVWQILPVLLLLICGLAGGVLGIIWYSSKRDEVARAAQAAGPAPYYGSPPPGWGPPPAAGGWAPPNAPPPYAPPPSYPPPQQPPIPPPAAPPPAPPAEPPQ